MDGSSRLIQDSVSLLSANTMIIKWAQRCRGLRELSTTVVQLTWYDRDSGVHRCRSHIKGIDEDRRAAIPTDPPHNRASGGQVTVYRCP